MYIDEAVQYLFQCFTSITNYVRCLRTDIYKLRCVHVYDLSFMTYCALTYISILYAMYQ